MIEAPANNPDDGHTPAAFHSGRGRSATALGMARFVFMASISGMLAWRSLVDAQPGTRLHNPLFDLAVSLVFVAMTLWLAARALITMLHVAFGDAPLLRLTPSGLFAPATTADIIPWKAVASARVARNRYSARLLIDLVPASAVRTKVWPFWPASTLTIWAGDPEAACAAIRGHPNYCGPLVAIDCCATIWVRAALPRRICSPR